MVIHLFIAHMGIGGAERVCVNLANEWADNGHEVHIAVLNLDNDIYTKDLHKGVMVHPLGVSRLRYAAPPMYMYIQRFRPRFMLVFGNEMAIIMNKLKRARMINTPIIVRVLNNVNISLAKEDKVSPAVEKYLKKAQKQIKNMDHVIAQCEGMGKQLLSGGLVDQSKMTVIYNPVSNELIDKVSKLREESGKPDGRKEIAFIGRIDPQKNPADLIEAFARVHEKYPEAVLRMVGSGNLDAQIKELVENKSLADSVIFDGIRDDMEQVYATADVVALSSDYEGMPNCLIEAIGCGIPVVSYDCPLGPSEIVYNDVNGYLVELHDVDALAARLIDALEKDWDVEQIKKTCNKFRVEKAAKKYEEIFRQFGGKMGKIRSNV